MKKALILLCLLLVCCKTNQYTNNIASIKINIQSEPQSLDPRKAREINSISITHMLFEGLTRLSPTGTIENSLAQDIKTSPDGKIFTFKLRKSFWSNGQPITSYDFAYSWKQILSPTFPTSMAYQLYIIKNAKEVKEGSLPQNKLGIYTPDDNTLVVELNSSIPYFTQLLASPLFAAINSSIDKDNSSWAYAESSYACSGPFKLKKWRHNEFIEIEKNENYWDKAKVKINLITMLMISSTAEYNMFEKGEIDWAGAPLSTLPIDILQDANVQIKPFMATAFIRINTNIFPQKLIRQHLSQMINREEIVKSLQAKQIPTQAFVPGSQFSFAITSEPLIDKNEITLTYVNQQRQHLTAQILQKVWMNKLNIPIKLEAVESKIFYERISKGKYELALGSWIADCNDPINFLDVFKYKTGNTNNTFWENKEYQHLLDQAEICSDTAIRNNLLKKAEELLLNEQPIIPLYHLTLNFLQNKKLKNVYISPTGVIDFKWAYVDF
jgi:oligopeptide transport system substrate-binding protein